MQVIKFDSLPESLAQDKEKILEEAIHNLKNSNSFIYVCFDKVDNFKFVWDVFRIKNGQAIFALEVIKSQIIEQIED